MAHNPALESETFFREKLLQTAFSQNEQQNKALMLAVIQAEDVLISQAVGLEQLIKVPKLIQTCIKQLGVFNVVQKVNTASMLITLFDCQDQEERIPKIVQLMLAIMHSPLAPQGIQKQIVVKHQDRDDILLAVVQ